MLKHMACVHGTKLVIFEHPQILDINSACNIGSTVADRDPDPSLFSAHIEPWLIYTLPGRRRQPGNFFA